MGVQCGIKEGYRIKESERVGIWGGRAEDIELMLDRKINTIRG